MKLTKEQLKQIIKETIEEMRIDTVAGDPTLKTAPPKLEISAEEFAAKYNLEVEVAEDGEKVIRYFDDDAWVIKASDVPRSWDSEIIGVEQNIYHTGEYSK